jgi:glycosyltransferase involved in cell wall biosynthesis
MKNAKLREVMGENGWQYVREKYSWPIILQKYSKLFDFLLQDGH